MTNKATTLAIGILASLGTLQAVPQAPVQNTTGFTSITLTPGYNAVSISLVNTAVFSGGVITPSGVTGSSIVNVAGGTDLNMGAPLDAGKLYYLEILRVPGTVDCLGARFEVNVAATKLSANNTVTLNLGSPTNTATAVPDLSGCSFVIREHVTVLQVFGGQGNVLLQGATDPQNADQVLFFDRVSRSYRTYWLRNNSGVTQWRSLNPADADEYSGMPIRPGEGLLVLRRAGALTLRHTGTVRTTPFRHALPAGPALVSHGSPADRTPAMGDMTVAAGWKGTGSSGSADVVQIWDGTSFHSYWLRANTSGSTQEWRSVVPTDATDYTNANLLHGDEAMFINSRQAAQRLVDLRN